MKSRAPQLHLEYRFYKQLGSGGKYNLANLAKCELLQVISILVQYIIRIIHFCFVCKCLLNGICGLYQIMIGLIMVRQPNPIEILVR